MRFHSWNEDWRRGNSRRMQCRARGSGSMAGEAGAAQGGGERPMTAVPVWSARGGRRKLAGPVGPNRPSRPAGLLG
jgi:hypothetical protein